MRETLTRTPKSRAVDWEGRPLFKGHDTQTLEVSWSPAEVALSNLLTQYIRKSLEASTNGSRGYGLAVALVMHTYHKIAASSWTALQAALERRAAHLAQGRGIHWEDMVEEDEDDGKPSHASTTSMNAASVSLTGKNSCWIGCSKH
ncbi:hypothetical protein NXS98_07270 [Fontisphaera persica]|uniref:hypothetical protein n=1 Tax=Fontisphaera persica TaxID=2974023 RepID=UPI0024C0027C|nr:hypothetical protein [Fontisphaera persica]WCJ60913.1 hypothetical protein NXS98_07270 [Fontisphaera persica]